MKKILLLSVVFAMAIVSMACGSGNEEIDGTTGATEQTGNDGDGKASGKMLVVYFSRAGENWQVGVVERGNTAIMVDYIKDLADVDVFEIEPANPYPEGYEDTKTVATAEFNNGTRPPIKTDCGSLADYETIFIGGPVWWARPPMIFRTFFEAHPELDGKTIIPFGTHGGSGVGSYQTLIREYYPNATILESLGISGSSIRNSSEKTTVANWLKRLGVDNETAAVRSVSTRSSNNIPAYSLRGSRATASHRGLYIKGGRKYVGTNN